MIKTLEAVQHCGERLSNHGFANDNNVFAAIMAFSGQNIPLLLGLLQESSPRASARREESHQPKDLGWLDPCDKHR
ncbi:hypothetical protein, partial [Agrobacterium tumefaciens]|uniref:hypothetical protein n=1 Tax=Agrobacterium tumefaciens TaxID=358 RepID=UPI003BA22362